MIIQNEVLKGSFRLRAWNEVFFVYFMIFFALLSARLEFKRGKINKRNKKNALCVVERALRHEKSRVKNFVKN